MGNMQRLPNGNTLIDWGSNLVPNITEVAPDGSKAFEIDFGKSDVSYRAFRFPWHGYPAWPPALVLQPVDGTLNLIFSWNGATDVAGYQIFASDASPPDTLLGTQPKTGFETTAVLQGEQASYCYYRVVPVDLQGRPKQASDTVLNGGAASCP